MSNDPELTNLLSALQNTVKLQAALMAKFEQREERMQASFEQRMQTLQTELVQLHQKVGGIVGNASSQIAEDARSAVGPVAAQYERDISAATARASRSAWLWLATGISTILLAILACWAVMGYYRRELASVQEALNRYDDAIPVLQAYYASDAVLCGGRVCVNVDPNGQHAGDKRQYRQAKPRE
ncbi:hypothetical protein [Stenotrophomonas sp. UBA7606]|uniref:hypothetical protein n=1 Tax=Stenotrophomonas sp. UBA7606 TaxID=1947559 RepID=UPI0025FD83CA|nr:hypothetical protein [Stenotrophomonas sp. UBA7606]